MSLIDGEKELEDFLARRASPLQRITERDRPEPPPELDRIVLAKAREAIESPAHQPMYSSPRWALPVGLAATIVISFAVILNLSRSAHNAGSIVATMGKQESAELTAAVASGKADTPVPAAPPLAPALAKRAASPAPVSAEPELYGNASGALAASARDSGAIESELRADAPTEQAPRTTGDSKLSDQDAAGSAESRAQRPARATSAKPDAQAWLRRIEQLRAQGKIAEANQQFAEYRKIFPSQLTPSAAAPRPPTR